jgi:hypothetical protein
VETSTSRHADRQQAESLKERFSGISRPEGAWSREIIQRRRVFVAELALHLALAPGKMASDHVLSIPRSDSKGDNVLVNVVPSGKASLDLKLVATEGTSPYITKSSRATK